MKLPTWSVPFALRLLSLAGLASAAGVDKAFTVGFGLGFTLSPAVATESFSLAQPRPTDVSLDLDFLVQVQNHELRIPIMPLHLLGHKSWNVYNKDNIEKVKRDEAVAQAKEEAEEQRMQEIDAERRLQILRGEEPTPLPEIEDKADDGEKRHRGPERERKRRKKAGENDTDFEMRIAHEQTVSNSDRQMVLRKPIDAPLVDHTGHINLFPEERPNKPAEKNAEAEKELAKKKKEYEDQYTVKFSNAAGFKQGLENPWYAKVGASKEVEEDLPGKDVWGNEDPRRKERQAARIVSNDPLAMMRQGAAQVRQVEKERKLWREEKEKEMRDLIESEERRNRHKRKHRNDDDDLEEFRLDKTENSSSRRRDDEREGKHRHRHRSSHDEEDRRHRHKHRRRHQE
ncbi:Uncharacterized protein LOCC1_G008077 [Lachnellula occidentalis]|uniref:CBF1-interacting co-repressor CIR N-terminal domain-containing protein n=1 Tax=Lachnellula occidentalis TaxID=215460 RepID=A0A8H8U3W0_9HELO|nr:Uncharacterized protein LOCC1_G008077 [Lachnellula occidentalis]